MPPISLDLQRDVWASQEQPPLVTGRATSIADGFASYSETSHVLFAACRSGQLAREKDRRGVFTEALLDTLACHGTKVTYEDLLRKMDHLRFVE
jgi:hypothetical protein